MSKDTTNILYDIQRRLNEVDEKVASLNKSINLAEKQKRLDELDEQILKADFWNDIARAKSVQKEKTLLEKQIETFNNTQKALQDMKELFELLKDDENSWVDISKNLKELEAQVKKLQMSRMLSKENDINNAILSINVGQGGVDSQDFSEMLLRMYRRYADRQGFKVELIDYQPGEEAGIKNATVLISGDYAYGFLKAEVGVHRLVRISPFDSGARRHTSFASVWVVPEIDDNIDVNIKPEDLRIDTFRAGGAGGQHVNKTESAVRITHIPTNTVVVCQAERSQIKNRSTAMKILKARLYELEERNRLAFKNKAEAVKLEASFGSQIRNYVLAPYRIVKDLRTAYEVGDVDSVLDGDIQDFIEAYLLSKAED